MNSLGSSLEGDVALQFLASWLASIEHTAGMVAPGIEGLCHHALCRICMTHCGSIVSPASVLSHAKPSLEGCSQPFGIASDQKILQSGIEGFVVAWVVVEGMKAVYQHFALCVLLCTAKQGPFPHSVLGCVSPSQGDCSHGAALYPVNLSHCSHLCMLTLLMLVRPAQECCLQAQSSS